MTRAATRRYVCSAPLACVYSALAWDFNAPTEDRFSCFYSSERLSDVVYITVECIRDSVSLELFMRGTYVCTRTAALINNGK